MTFRSINGKILGIIIWAHSSGVRPNGSKVHLLMGNNKLAMDSTFQKQGILIEHTRGSIGSSNDANLRDPFDPPPFLVDLNTKGMKQMK